MSVNFPSAPEFGRLLGKLLGRPVKARDSYDLVERGATGVFVDSEGKERAWIAFEVPIAGAAGAALAMIPAKVAENGSRGGRLEEMLHENYYEVINILGRVFNGDDGFHVVLKDIGYGNTPDPLQDNKTVVYDVESTGYGKGKVALAAA